MIDYTQGHRNLKMPTEKRSTLWRGGGLFWTLLKLLLAKISEIKKFVLENF